MPFLDLDHIVGAHEPQEGHLGKAPLQRFYTVCRALRAEHRLHVGGLDPWVCNRSAGGFEAFRQRVLSASVEDVIDQGIRKVAYQRDGLALGIEYDPTRDDVVPPASINSQPREVPRFRAPGIDMLPW